MATKTSYIDSQGNTRVGYLIDGQTYKDSSGTSRIDVGSKVQTGGGWYELGESGGFKIDNPTLNSTPKPSASTSSSSPTSNELKLNKSDYESTMYFDPLGEEKIGFLINDKTYKDKYGKTRVDVGSKVQAEGPDNTVQWWELGENGGFKIDSPYVNMPTEEPQENMLQNSDYERYLTERERDLYKRSDNQYNEILNYKPERYMALDEAQARAAAMFRQPFDKNLEETMREYDESAISRGMYGQQPIEELKRNAMTESEISEQNAVNSLAHSIYGDEFNKTSTKNSEGYNNLVNKLSLTGNQLIQENQKKTEVLAYKNQELGTKLETQKSVRENAYERWNSLGYADKSVSEELNIEEGTPAKKNMEEKMKTEYSSALAEYKSLLALRELSKKQGYNISLAGYKNNLALDQAIAKAQIEIQKKGAILNLEAESDATELANEYELKEDFEKFKNDLMTPEFKLKVFNTAIDNVSLDNDTKKKVINSIGETYPSGHAKAGQLKSPEDVLNELTNVLGATNYELLMDEYNGMLYTFSLDDGSNNNNINSQVNNYLKTPSTKSLME